MLNAGVNALGTLTLDSVPSQIIFENENLQSTGCPSFAIGNCFVGQYGIADALGDIITLPGNFTQSPVPGPSVGGAETLIYDYIAPDANGTDYGFSFACTASGDFPVTIDFYVYQNTFDISPYISTAEMTAYNLQTPTSAVNWPQYDCTNGTISAVGPASGSVSVQGKKH
jgi:hypothetical protein